MQIRGGMTLSSGFMSSFGGKKLLMMGKPFVIGHLDGGLQEKRECQRGMWTQGKLGWIQGHDKEMRPLRVISCLYAVLWTSVDLSSHGSCGLTGRSGDCGERTGVS